MPYADPEARRRYIRAYYAKNRVQLLEYAERYRQEHSDRVMASLRRIYAARREDSAFKRRAATSQRRRRVQNWEHVRAIERESYQRHREERIATQKALARTPKALARAFLNRKVRDGRFPRASMHACACGKRAREYHHHLGYAPEHWLSVIPLCSKCHRAAH